MTIFEQLAAPFPPDAISWRAQSLTRDKGKAMALAYIDARDVMRRLDDVCGPGGWQCRYPHANGKTICEIGIWIEREQRVPNAGPGGATLVDTFGEWIWKANGAGDTDIEAEKGAISDAFKRAAVLWGIGRYLYDMPTVWAECELGDNGKWRNWTPKGLNTLGMAAARHSREIAQSAPAKEAPPADALITDDQRDWLASKITASGVPVGDVCKEFGISSLKELTFGRAQEAVSWLKTQKKAA